MKAWVLKDINLDTPPGQIMSERDVSGVSSYKYISHDAIQLVVKLLNAVVSPTMALSDDGVLTMEAEAEALLDKLDALTAGVMVEHGDYENPASTLVQGREMRAVRLEGETIDDSDRPDSCKLLKQMYEINTELKQLERHITNGLGEVLDKVAKNTETLDMLERG